MIVERYGNGNVSSSGDGDDDDDDDKDYEDDKDDNKDPLLHQLVVFELLLTFSLSRELQVRQYEHLGAVVLHGASENEL